MKALVTGGAGFIGSHIVDRLLADGYEVVVIDDLSTGKRENLQAHDKLELVVGDIRDAKLVAECIQGVSLVFHKAAVASVSRTVDDPVGSSEVNYTGTLNILEAARQHDVARVVFASSAALYGDEPTLPKMEQMIPVTLSPYSVDKLASEYACGMYSSLYGLDTVCLRYFNVFGPRQDPSSPYSGVISIFNDRLDSGTVPTIYGDGEQTRDFVYVSDVVEANMQAALRAEPVGMFVNIATGDKITLNELLKTFCEIKGVDFKVEYEDGRKGDIRHSYADISRAKQLLGWKPEIELRRGLEHLCMSIEQVEKYG